MIYDDNDRINISRAELLSLRTDYANLLAAARVTLISAINHDPDPLVYLVDELANHNQLPPQVSEYYGNDPLAAWLDHSDDWLQR